MAPALCASCKTQRALVKRPKNHDKLCKACFIFIFEEEVHHTIVSSALFSPGQKVAIGASGGKDSTVLASCLKSLNAKYHYGVDLILLSIDEGIKGYRDDSLETVKRNAVQYDMPLTVVGYHELYGWTMDEVVKAIGKKGNCTYCGVFRRQALDRGAKMLGIKHLVTGHNADDVAETILMNLLRGDLPRLGRSTSIVTGDDTCDVKRSKPLKYSYEKEIVLYAHHKKLDYFSTECIYSPEAFRGTARTLIKNLERVRPSAILDIVRSGEDMARLVMGGHDACACRNSSAARVNEDYESGCGALRKGSNEEVAHLEAQLSSTAVRAEMDFASHHAPVVPSSQAQIGFGVQILGKCKRCGYMSSQDVCQACLLVDGLNKNKPKIQV
ncbi:Cytoplasmic tRNA 2-thiolation protein 1 [Colletotrichum spinosum]|uniref:Cytoplasmic tRNA 2-thiolation protein 1 n=1 Tax=Colletotrichum spinosum TaxID=1347390 RepID=A0A4R8PRL0_9PEZI|nr:Cytoplasmic tRNA 2-thiolation protein 1 [Colletotrichum spinosum]